LREQRADGESPGENACVARPEMFAAVGGVRVHLALDRIDVAGKEPRRGVVASSER
jgi:hypothetical protein